MATSTISVNNSAKKTTPFIPYCFNSIRDAQKALTALKEEFTEFEKSYSIGKTLFVPEHRNIRINRSAEDFVRTLGGRLSNEV